MLKNKRLITRLLVLILAAVLCFGLTSQAWVAAAEIPAVKSLITNISGIEIDNNTSSFFDESVIYALPDELESDDIISVIVSIDMDSVYDAYNKLDSDMSISEYASTADGIQVARRVNTQVEKRIKQLRTLGIDFTVGERYDTLLAGFEIEIKASDYEAVSNLLTSETLILGDVYAKCETEVVTNDVDVYDTGIFDSSLCDYQGDGVVIAVLDTGLDYTHTAFSVDNFQTSNEAFTLDTVSSMVSQTTASKFTNGLTGEDVYVSKKVPYAYDYADKDPDVAPINSEHGTHVAGIIAGKDDTITGVAPNAQLAIFKVFSDHQDGAKTSWIVAALEDCVVLGVDVINMSLGSACGFTREVDKENVNKIYDKVYDSGIELIASAANQYNSTMGSTKNGNNGLTSNPDTGTVGAPSTYQPALSVASVNGTKTSYLKVGEQIIYFNEAYTNSADDTKSFVDDVLNTISTDTLSYDFEYVVIPGLGRSSDYPQDDSFYQGKIVLVKRGTTTFEDKVRVALLEKGASGIIIYNNVSGTISMSVGANVGAVCSISQDDGKYLISQINSETGIGKLSISRENLAGPFMSDFSSWGPTSDLHIKPEITAHGGNILSAVPGQEYEKLSGTSMAAPNLAGAAALICQYVKYSGVFGSNLTTREVTNIVNQLMMSTADIITDKNGLPSAVRKQGAGLISIGKSTTAESYVSTYDLDGNKMDKAKLELGDDKRKTGIYEMTLDINNVSSSSATYDISAIVLTEGVSTTYTSHGEKTVTQTEYLLSGAKIEVISVTNGTQNNNTVVVGSKQTATIKVKITLSDSDKKYLNDSFENGMYVEGFLTFEAKDGTTVDLNVPFLAFYGDWTEAPIFDEEYYDTNVDEINKGLDDEDKLMADAYATRVIGGLYSDYISTLGSYYFVQNPKATQIAASKDHIAVSNQNTGKSSGSTISSIRSVNAGLLRNAKEIYVSIVEDSTGEEIYTDIVYNQRKSYSSGSTIYASSIDIDYDVLSHNLKNNTAYTVTLTAYIDYGTNEDQKNDRNTFSFPFYVDFEAPIVTDVTYRTEYDRSSKTTKLYADLSIYDNHYSMGVQIGQITKAPEGSEYSFSMESFGKYVTPVYSSYNSTSIVSIELTDYVSNLKNSCGIKYNADGSFEYDYNNNSFIATVYDYAMNSATYQIELPDEITYMYFNQDETKLSPNETLDLSTVLTVYPSTSWIQTLDFTSSDSTVVGIVNNTLIAKKSGTVTITATGKDANGNTVSTTMDITVLSPGDEGYVGNYSIPEINKFELTGYKTIKAYYDVSSDKRDIGVTGGEYAFGDEIVLNLFPSEKVQLLYTLDSYFPEATSVTFKASNTKIATVTEDGIVEGKAKGNTTIMINVLYNGKSTLYSAKVAITVKDPFSIQSIYLYYYRGLGGTVEIPSDRGITTIYNYAFANYEYVEKDLENGDVIDEEDPYYIKQQYIGEDEIKKVIIPEGVTTINSYAFANLTGLEEVVLPSTLTRIGVGAFYNCTSLTKINLEHVKFINEQAFYNCPLTEIDLSNAVSIGTFAFQNCKLNYVVLPASAQSLSDGAFYNNTTLTSVTIKASKIKIGNYAFAGCSSLQAININAAVISSYAFYGCTELKEVTLGADVAVIGEGAFYDTSVEKFNISTKNKVLKTEENGALVLKGDELVLVAPNYKGVNNVVTTSATSITSGAFMGNSKIFKLVAPNLKVVGSYAFAFCTNLYSVEMPLVEEIGEKAFYMNLKLTSVGSLDSLKTIGDYAFYNVPLETLTIVDNVTIGSYAFANDVKYALPTLKSITLGNNVTVGDYAFFVRIVNNSYEVTQQVSALENYYTPYNYEVTDEEGNVVETNSYYKYNFTSGVYSVLTTLSAGNNLTVGEGAFFGNGILTTVNLGSDAVIGNYAFYSCASLNSLDFSKVKSIGEYAFAGYRTQDFWIKDNSVNYAYEKEYNDGVFRYTAYIYSCYAPCFTSLDLSNVESIGKGAFLGNTALTNVTVSDKIDEIGAYTFANCNSLTSITLKDNITSIGEFAFYNSALASINLEKVDSIGNYAFYNTKVNNIVFKDGVTIGDAAFYYAKKLSIVDNTKNIASIGANAFSLTSFDTVDLTNVKTIGDFAFSQSALTSVVLGDKIESLGENPFYGCEIETFGKVTIISGKGYTHKEITETYDLNEKVKVIDGVLYQVIPTGYELVSYPQLKDNKEYTINENTTRITAAAFAYSKIETVTLSNVLKSIGDKAFYGCDELSVVVFTSYIAPKLEEEYDTSYLTYLNLPISGYLGEYEGLGISKYYMWNITSNYTNFYFGANFKDYIGHDTGDLVIARPSNGQNYDSFIFDQYFDTVVYGAAAPTLATINVIKLINNIPSYVTLASEAQIVAAREAYAQITSTEQQALVTNYSDLVSAESTLTYLKNRENPAEPEPEDPVDPKPAASKFGTFMKNNAVGFSFSGVLIIAFAVVLFVLLKRKRHEE